MTRRRSLAPWAVPGQKGLEHRIGGLEKLGDTGDISYDPGNHHRMTLARAERVARVAEIVPPLEVNGPAEGDLLLLGWGGTYGAITSAAENARKQGKSVASAHLRYLNPFPSNLGEVLSRYKKVMIPEFNGTSHSSCAAGSWWMRCPSTRSRDSPSRSPSSKGRSTKSSG